MSSINAYSCRVNRQAGGWVSLGRARGLSMPVFAQVGVVSVSTMHKEVASTD
jgi:hypothetical protein